jgi:hypothetical protein
MGSSPAELAAILRASGEDRRNAILETAMNASAIAERVCIQHGRPDLGSVVAQAIETELLQK